ncbi:hypothetical protein NKH77_36040 [Streptomyces sp. M19]
MDTTYRCPRAPRPPPRRADRRAARRERAARPAVRGGARRRVPAPGAPARADGDTNADAALGELLACGLVTPAGGHYRLVAGRRRSWPTPGTPTRAAGTPTPWPSTTPGGPGTRRSARAGRRRGGRDPRHAGGAGRRPRARPRRRRGAAGPQSRARAGGGAALGRLGARCGTGRRPRG